MQAVGADGDRSGAPHDELLRDHENDVTAMENAHHDQSRVPCATGACNHAVHGFDHQECRRAGDEALCAKPASAPPYHVRTVLASAGVSAWRTAKRLMNEANTSSAESASEAIIATNQ